MWRRWRTACVTIAAISKHALLGEHVLASGAMEAALAFLEDAAEDLAPATAASAIGVTAV